MSPSQAYIKTRSSNGNIIKWSFPKKVSFLGNTINGSSMSSKDFFDSVVKGLETWKDASHGLFTFDYSQGQDNTSFPKNSDYNQKSSIYFGSLDPSVIGMTQQWFNNQTGEMLETDVQLNDSYFYFTKNPTDSTSVSGTSADGRRYVFIDNVLTHELGHAMGLSHEEGLHSTMFYQEFFNQRQISCDERAGMHSNYPNISQAGIITGRTLGPNGQPLFGVHVIAISLVRGAPISSVLSDKDGTFSIEGLEPGSYSLLFEPYFPTASNLTSYYSGMNHVVCGSYFFPRQMDSRVFAVSSQTVSGAGDVSITCSTTFKALASNVLNDLSHPIDLGQVSSGSAEYWSGAFGGARNDLYYGFTTTGGNLKLSALANTFYSQTQASVELRDDVGTLIQPSVNQYPAYSADGMTNYDQAVQYANLPAGHYVAHIKKNNVSNRMLAGGSQLLDANQFFIVTLAQDLAASLPSVYPENIKCSKVLPQSTYQSPGGNPDKPKGGCGSIQAVSGSDGGNGWTSFGAAIPYLLMGIMLRFARRRLNLLE